MDYKDIYEDILATYHAVSSGSGTDERRKTFVKGRRLCSDLGSSGIESRSRYYI